MRLLTGRWLVGDWPWQTHVKNSYPNTKHPSRYRGSSHSAPIIPGYFLSPFRGFGLNAPLSESLLVWFSSDCGFDDNCHPRFGWYFPLCALGRQNCPKNKPRYHPFDLYTSCNRIMYKDDLGAFLIPNVIIQFILHSIWRDSNIFKKKI